jgi:hypothetical protein
MKSMARIAICGLLLTTALTAEETVATALYARVGNGYKREKAKDGSFKPEYYALSNGGRIAGTGSDVTIDRVAYPEMAGIVMRLLAQQNYRYAQTKEQAKLLIVLQWGSTIAPNGTNYSLSMKDAGAIYSELREMLRAQGMGSLEASGGLGESAGGNDLSGASAISDLKSRFESAMLRLLADNRVRDQVNERNAKVLGYMDDLAETNDIRRWAGGGDRFNDLLADVEESRYYFIISAYDFPELLKTKKQKLLWQTRVSVRSPGNSFDDSFVAMLNTSSKYFGKDSGRLVRGEESKGSVELIDLKFLGEAKVQPDTKPEARK